MTEKSELVDEGLAAEPPKPADTGGAPSNSKVSVTPVASDNEVAYFPSPVKTYTTSSPICLCKNANSCVTLKDILDSFKSPLSEEQAWSLIFQFVMLYRTVARSERRYIFTDLEIPNSIENINLHPDGTVHCSWSDATRKEKERGNDRDKEAFSSNFNVHSALTASHKNILRKLAVIVYSALDYNLSSDEQCQMSQELEELITFMTFDETDDDGVDEGIDEGYKRWDEENDDDQISETKEFDVVLRACTHHVKPTVPEDHYKAVCRALVTETIELRIFLQQVLNEGAENLHLKTESESSKQELAQLGFNDWARFWVQVIDELRQGVRLKKNNYPKAPIEYELTPYEILMEDIRSKKYQLRKVMINGDIPPRVKKDAHALILEFIRSRPPLKKASDRKLPPPIKRTPSPREQLMDSIRKGQKLKHVPSPTFPHLKDRLHPSAMKGAASMMTTKMEDNMDKFTTPRSKQRLIKVDFSLLQDDDSFHDDSLDSASNFDRSSVGAGMCSQPKMPPYPIGYMITGTTAKIPATKLPSTLTARVPRRTTYDLATQCESRRTSLRRHTIVGCQSNFDETRSMPSSRPESRQSDVHAPKGSAMTKENYNTINTARARPNVNTEESDESDFCSDSSSSVGPWNKSFLDEKTWNERGDDRLSLTLEEIVHIRSVMTKAELEGLPVGVRVKEDVEKRKICFLCLRTRFSIFGPWGIQCRLCQRTVCSKCYSKMRIPSEHFRKVPLVLVSPSLLATPTGSSTPSPSRQLHHTHSSSIGNILDETFPKSLFERLLRSESEKKARNSVGSAPSSPKHQRSNMSTPGNTSALAAVTGHAVEALIDDSSSTSEMPYTKSTHLPSSQASHLLSYSIGDKRNSKAGTSRGISIMSRSMEGPQSLPAHSPARPHSNSSTLDRKSKLSRAFTLSSSGTHLSQEQKDNLRGELVPVCNDCKGLVMEITRSSKQTRSSARNRALQNLTLDLSPVYK